MNLWYETKTILAQHGKTFDDIKWVGGNEFTIDKDQFVKLADKTNYDNGYGSPQVALDLVLVGEDFYLTRDEYDGSEWWSWHCVPTMPTEHRSVLRVATNGVGWLKLDELNNDFEEEDG